MKEGVMIVYKLVMLLSVSLCAAGLYALWECVIRTQPPTGEVGFAMLCSLVLLGVGYAALREAWK